MHITVPSGATVITSDLSKYLTGPKSGIKAEVEEADEEEKARDVSLHRCNAPHILGHVRSVYSVTQFQGKPWGRSESQDWKHNSLTGVESFTGKNRKILISGVHLQTSVN